jgi:hypothetical protein
MINVALFVFAGFCFAHLQLDGGDSVTWELPPSFPGSPPSPSRFLVPVNLDLIATLETLGSSVCRDRAHPVIRRFAMRLKARADASEGIFPRPPPQGFNSVQMSFLRRLHACSRISSCMGNAEDRREGYAKSTPRAPCLSNGSRL